MGLNSRREFLRNTVVTGGALAASATVAGAVGQASVATANSAFETQSSVSPPWVPVRVLDTEKMPWESNYRVKRLFQIPGEKGAGLSILNMRIGDPGQYHHYHTFHEWAYNLAGDYTNNEGIVPAGVMGPLNRFREGFFMDRPAYSLHGGEKGREEWMQSQVGALILIFEEPGHTYSPDPQASFYNPDWKSVKEWKMSRIIDTIGAMPWQPEGTVPGLKIKYCANDPTRGFRAILRWLEAGWNSSQAPQFARGYYYKNAWQFNYLINGDLAIQSYRAPGEKAEKLNLDKDFYFERAPMSMFGLADGVVTERGAYWLEVTYAKGHTVSDTPIEDPTWL